MFLHTIGQLIHSRKLSFLTDSLNPAKKKKKSKKKDHQVSGPECGIKKKQIPYSLLWTSPKSCLFLTSVKVCRVGTPSVHRFIALL